MLARDRRYNPRYLLWPMGLLLWMGGAQCASNHWQGGIHAKLRFSQSHGLRVVHVPDTGPAALAGLRQGDRIVDVDGEAVEHLTLKQVVSRLRGPVGSHVELRIERNGRQRSIRIERAPYDDRALL